MFNKKFRVIELPSVDNIKYQVQFKHSILPIWCDAQKLNPNIPSRYDILDEAIESVEKFKIPIEYNYYYCGEKYRIKEHPFKGLSIDHKHYYTIEIKCKILLIWRTYENSFFSESRLSSRYFDLEEAKKSVEILKKPKKYYNV